MRYRLPRLIFLLVLLCAPLGAAATDYSDLWWNPLESGWGVTLGQSDNFIFATFFVYGANNLPTWYVGTLTADGNGNYTGDMIATTGSYFGAVPYNPAQHGENTVGTATFTPTAADTGTLTYTVNGVQVTKTIERLTLTVIALGGAYSGGQAGAYAGCSNSNNNSTYRDLFDAQVTQQTDGNVSFVFSYQSGVSCTLSGTLQQKGQLYSVPNATYQCTGSQGGALNTSAAMSEIKATSLGIEGRFSAPSVGLGCHEDAQFSAVLL